MKRVRIAAVVVVAVAAVSAAVVAVVALVPASYVYEPAPLVRALKESAALPIDAVPLPLPVSDVVLRDVRIVGRGEARMSIRVERGVITAIDPMGPSGSGAPEDSSVRDLDGAWVMPGLIDAHVHLSLAPAAAVRGDDAATSAALRAHHLRAYLASGVTTIVDPAVDEDVARHVQRTLAAGHAGPRYLHLGPPFVVEGGYVADLFPTPVSDDASVAAHFDRLRACGAAGAKLPIEPGVFQPVWHTPSPTLLRTIADQAKARAVPLYVHALTEDAYNQGLALAPHAFVHHSGTATDDLVARVAASRAYVVSTIAIYAVHRYALNLAALDEPHVKRVVPAVVRAGLLDPEAVHAANVGLIGEVMPALAGRWADVAAALQGTDPGRAQVDATAAETLRAASDGLRRMHQAGVPIVLGSDAGNWPVFPYYLHGPTTLFELEHLVSAGLSPAAAIDAATIVPARMLGLDDEIGAVQVGRRADLVVTGAAVDPLADPGKALRDVRLVVKDGVARTPDEWMAAP
jgi:imidazolonepropionase-like amidohydrolase